MRAADRVQQRESHRKQHSIHYEENKMMGIIRELGSLVTTLFHGSVESKVTIVLFVLVLSVALLFEWLWLRERNQRPWLERLQSDSKNISPNS